MVEANNKQVIVSDVKAKQGIAPFHKRAWATIRDFCLDKPLGAVAGALFFFMCLLAIVAPWVSPQDPMSTNVLIRLLPPSLAHLFGTDDLGRDILSRVIAGARLTISIGVTASFVGSIVGTLVGIISGYLGGKTDMAVQRIMDMMMAFPSLVLAIAIMAVLGGSVQNVILAIAIPMIPRSNRISRSIAVSIREFVFIEAAKAVGVPPARIIFRHVLPNCVAAYLIVISTSLGVAILIEASLSFLGLGVPPPHPSWGRSLNEAIPFYNESIWPAIFPGIAISLAVFGANLFGDALRDKLDPRLKRL